MVCPIYPLASVSPPEPDNREQTSRPLEGKNPEEILSLPQVGIGNFFLSRSLKASGKERGFPGMSLGMSIGVRGQASCPDVYL